MSKIQYTIRNIPPDVDSALRLRATKNKQSFNTTVVEALNQATKASKTQAKTDLDWFYGSGGIEQPELDEFAKQRVIDLSTWDQ